MAFLGAGSSKAAAPPNYVGVPIQTSSEGMVLPVIYGTNRTAPNVIWVDNFHSSGGGGKKGGGGKGGGKGGKQQTYSAGVIMAVCEGPVSYGLVYVDTSTVTTVFGLFLTPYNGTSTQLPFDCISSLPGFVPIAYRGIAYLATNAYDLGSTPALPQHNLEVYGFFATPSGVQPFDVNPQVFLTDILTNTRYGLGIPSSMIGDLTQYGTYCQALNLLMSPCLDKEEQAISIFQRWAQLSNTWIFWSENKLKAVPLGDSTVSAYGVTYTPVTTVRYALGYDQFITKSGDAPLTITRSEPSQAYNWVKLNCRDRLNQYNSAALEYKDETSIRKWGAFQANSISADEICSRDIGAVVVGLIGARAVYIRNTYKFTLSYYYILLEPGDIVTLTDANIGLLNYPVRIREIAENEQGDLAVVAEECPSGIGSAAGIGVQVAGAISLPSADADPGMVNAPAIVEPPASVTGGAAQVWIGASGSNPLWGGAIVHLSVDDVTYVEAGTIITATPQGVLITALPISADPDTTDTLSVDFSESLRTLSSVATHADADASRALIMVNSEVIGYGSVVPNGLNAYAYDLSYLRRAAYGGLIATAAIGDPAALITASSMLQIALPSAYVGQTIYVKLCSFNILGGGLEDISTVTRYTYVPTGLGAAVAQLLPLVNGDLPIGIVTNSSGVPIYVAQ